jgi:hypothetical protein
VEKTGEKAGKMQYHYNIFILQQRKKTVLQYKKTVAIGLENGFQGVLY